ncbi:MULTISPECIES: TIGR03617 family F420-dependent LLM class oxidoreductase [Amycolatopsis]|uniref:TIGR03617 family F420-dependent LLM class oxidoreductase n=1 Tax=Amycolatopsis TaxID=1813 RepID=UPI000B8AA86A|nr:MULTISPECIES: TIGR03617 family F420-dependent LLM class oxidoreductase [Amycolatopsis]OXM67151.1 LLM class F420-dependent oxidoreductase [Amycolatopsis sp. KNN50.9b]
MTAHSAHTPAIDVLVDAITSPETVSELEAAGCDGVWVTETVRDPFLALAEYARVTRTTALATGVAIAFARSPMTLAMSAHDLQRISGGRLTLGLGSQVKPHIERRFSMPWSEPAERMREYVLALRAIWACWNEGEPLDFQGRFYRHTLMTPFFNPGPHGFGRPSVVLGGVGQRMTAVAGEVADGFLCAPLTSPRSLEQYTLPALGRTGEGFTITATPFVVTGEDATATARVEDATRRRIAFYASTPAYRTILEVHGWGARAEELTRLSRAGEWKAMAGLVDDEMLDAFAVVAAPDQVAAAVRERWGDTADRVALFVAADPGPEAAAELVRIVGRVRAGRAPGGLRRPSSECPAAT